MSEAVLHNHLSAERRKRLGQYFSGLPLARLLSELASADRARSVIDPMCGIGDMLVACAERNDNREALTGVDIDGAVVARTRQRLAFKGARTQLLAESAFACTLSDPRFVRGFDLVITNPPYVRYQRLSSGSANEPSGDDARTVRAQLLQRASEVAYLDARERSLFKHIIESYSGHSDLAIPSWILCALLTKPGGRIAMVLPESWLSRDYAAPVRLLLGQCFRTEFVVEDAHATWFHGDALVRTHLLIARRIAIEKPPEGDKCRGHLHVRLFRAATSGDSLIAGLFESALHPERVFARDMRRLLARRAEYRVAGKLEVEWHAHPKQTIPRTSRPFVTTHGVKKTAKSGDSTHAAVRDPFPFTFLHHSLGRILGQTQLRALSTLSDSAVNVSQGLRTGANQFFYVDLLEELHDYCLVAPHVAFACGPIIVPSRYLQPVLRRQVELPVDSRLRASSLRGRVLILNGLSAISTSHGPAHSSSREAADGTRELWDYIHRAETTNLGSRTAPRFVPHLSAVRTNSRVLPSGSNRHWFELPAMMRRHRPELLIPRIVQGAPRAYLNAARPIIIDANFSTLWLGPTSTLTSYGLLALFQSGWVDATIELSASVLGGGALKLEATHLRRLPIPNIVGRHGERLDRLGRSLVETSGDEALIEEIERTVLGSIVATRRIAAVSRDLHELCVSRRDARNNRRREG